MTKQKMIRVGFCEECPYFLRGQYWFNSWCMYVKRYLTDDNINERIAYFCPLEDAPDPKEVEVIDPRQLPLPLGNKHVCK